MDVTCNTSDENTCSTLCTSYDLQTSSQNQQLLSPTALRQPLATVDNILQITPNNNRQTKIPFKTPGHQVTPERYELIRDLDDAENWKERATIVTKIDHEENVQLAHRLLNEILHQLPIERLAPVSTSEPGKEIYSSNVDNIAFDLDDLFLLTETTTCLSEEISTLVHPIVSADTSLVDEFYDANDIIQPVPPMNVTTGDKANSYNNDVNTGIESNTNCDNQTLVVDDCIHNSSILPPVSSNHTMMSDNASEAESPLPVPKGAYTIDWDNIDENTNPFSSSPKKGQLLGESPPVGRTLPDNTQLDSNEIDAFTPYKVSLSNSPLQCSNELTKNNIEHLDTTSKEEYVDHVNNVKSMDNANTAVISIDESCTMNETSETDKNELITKTAKKPISSTKPVQKHAKFRPPRIPKCDDSNEIEIFLPGQKLNISSGELAESDKPTTVHAPETLPSTDTSTDVPERLKDDRTDYCDTNQNSDDNHDHESPVFPGLPRRAEGDDLEFAVPDLPGLPTDGENRNRLDGEDASHLFSGDEIFDPAGETFRDSSGWDMLDKFGATSESKESALSRESLYVKFDPLVGRVGSPVIAKAKTISISDVAAIPIPENDDLWMMNTPPSNSVKHPAVNALKSQTCSNELTNTPKVVDQLFSCSPSCFEQADGERGDGPTNLTPLGRPRGLPDGGDDKQIIDILKYSQHDVNRMRHEWELIARNQMLTKKKKVPTATLR